MKRKRGGSIPALLLFSALGFAPAWAGRGQDTTKPLTDGRVVVFFGDSLTAGYGLDPAQAYPAIIQDKISARGWDFRVVNAGVSGETTAGGLRRVDWVLQRPLDVFVLELGANDGLRGLPLEEATRNLQAIIDRVKGKYPGAKIVLAGMQIPPNLGRDYATRFRDLFPALARRNGIPLIPFLLEGVGGESGLNLPDGIHPTPEGHRAVAENVWKVLEPVLQSVRQDQN
jgi:acyl-CoA thioesterase-1